ncbi:MAG: class I SAM-dependent methyltransferase [Bacteroidetes bacterium]|nr:class I SAM-dependent methyltransferase [Bacteroidota bacterium]
MPNPIRKIKSLFSKPAFSSGNYWEERYRSGGNSGGGSYGRLADFKARVLNEFVKRNTVRSIVEFGCGDGNQLSLAEYPQYTGLDISPTIIDKCKQRFAADPRKRFFVADEKGFRENGDLFKSELSLSLDVLYHLTEQSVYENYLKSLFNYAEKYVIIYSSNQNIKPFNSHELHRKFTDDVDRLVTGWRLVDQIANDYQPTDLADDESSMANFYFYQRTQQA